MNNNISKLDTVLLPIRDINYKNNLLNKNFCFTTTFNEEKKRDAIKLVESAIINMILPKENSFCFDTSLFSSNQTDMINSMYNTQLSIDLSEKGLGLEKMLKSSLF